MTEEMERIYATAKAAMQITPLKITTYQLNYLYNILCRARRDEAYNAKFRHLEDGTDLIDTIETYFADYNNFHGMDITEILTEFTDERFAEGLYCIGRTYDEDGNERDALSFRANEKVYFRVTVYSHHTDLPVQVPMLKWTVRADDAAVLPTEGQVTQVNTVTFSSYITHPGFIKAMVIPCDETGKQIMGSESFEGGAGADVDQVRPLHSRPHDFGTFWRKQMKRLYAVDPTSTKCEGYTGRVQTLFDVVNTNYFRMKKLSASDLQILREKQITTVEDSCLEDYDIYSISLKAPGPCPSTMALSIPKKAKEKPVAAVFTYDGYSAHSPGIILSDEIEFHVTHHGYPTDLSDAECYNTLNGNGILGAYGMANGRPNADFVDAEDCYLLYMFLRDFQALRFMADESLNQVIPGLYQAWDGTMKVRGGSMGGYQTLGICALPKYIPAGVPAIHVVLGTPNIPAFCDLAGPVSGRYFQMGQRGYESNMDYFDTAHFAVDIQNEVIIPRCALGDSACPISGVYSMFNMLTCPKQITVYQNSTHGYIPEEKVQITYTIRFD